MHQDVRGSGKSVEGEFALFSQEEQNDFYDMVEWIAAQGWCTGKMGMIGESYLAWVQWFTAAMQPPHLACIVPFDGGADMYRDVAFHGGIMALGIPGELVDRGDPGNYRLGKYGPGADRRRVGPALERDPSPRLRRVLEDPQPRLFRRSKCRSIASAFCTRWESICGATSAATRWRRLPRNCSFATGISRATRWPSSTPGRCNCCICAGTTTGSRVTTPA